MEKYNGEGHYSTTDLIARMAGFQKDEAKKTSAKRLMACGFSTLLHLLESGGSPSTILVLLPNVMNVLHSLHNGNHAEVLERGQAAKRNAANDI